MTTPTTDTGTGTSTGTGPQPPPTNQPTPNTNPSSGTEAKHNHPPQNPDNKGSQSNQSDSTPTETTPSPEDHTIGSGEAVTDATAARGEGTRRRGFLRQADRIRTVEGDAVGRDKVVNIFGTEETVRLPRMSPVLVESARKVFVAPQRWGDVVTLTVKKRVVVLRGTVGHGRTTAALRLLPAAADPVYHLGAAELHRLNDVLLSVDQDTKNQDVRGAGFVLDDPKEFAALADTALRGLEAALEAAEAHLVLTVDVAANLPGEGFLDHVVDLPGPPLLSEVLAAHLRRRLDDDRANALLARPDIRELLDEQLTADTACAVAVRLADILADEELSGRAEPARVRRRMSRRAADDFATWFGGLPDVETRCHAVALAVLEGVGQETVAVAAAGLLRRLDSRPDVLVTDAAVSDFLDREDPFRPTQDELLGRLRARTTTAVVDGPFGAAPIEAVEYLDPAYPAEVLRHVWTRHRIHDDLLDWLTGLAVDRSEQIRVLAGVALGTLATLSFEYVCQRVLGPWALDESRFRREAVAYALRVVAAEPDLAGNVRSLTGGWYPNRERPLAQATAALVHGMALGRRDPEASIDALLRLLTVDDTRVAIAVSHGLAELIETGETPRARRILIRLAAATEDQRTVLPAQLVFLLLAVLMVVDRERPGSPGATTVWPHLLNLATMGPAERDPILRLWRRALEGPPLQDEAAAVLGTWAAAAEADPDLCEAFLRLALAIAKDHDRSRRILLRLAATWTEDDNLAPLPKTGDALRRVLSRPPERA